MLQRYYRFRTDITNMLQGYYKDVQTCHRDITAFTLILQVRMLLTCYIHVTKILQVVHDITRILQGCHKGITSFILIMGPLREGNGDSKECGRRGYTEQGPAE